MTQTPPDDDKGYQTRTSMLVDSLTQLAGLTQTVEGLDTTLQKTQRTQDRFKWVLGAMGLFILIQGIGIFFVIQAANNAEDSAQLLESCLIPGNECATRLAKAGQSGLVRQMDFQICWGSVVPEERTGQVMQDCKAKTLQDLIKEQRG